MLYGNVSLCAATYWTIIVRNVVACAESRRAFRQKVGVEAQILWGPGLHFRAKCQVEDISLVGVAIHSPLKLEIGSRIVLSIPALIEDGPNYELPCSVVVRRNTAEAGLPPKEVSYEKVVGPGSGAGFLPAFPPRGVCRGSRRLPG